MVKNSDFIQKNYILINETTVLKEFKDLIQNYDKLLKVF